jgi:hypothetical protein
MKYATTLALAALLTATTTTLAGEGHSHDIVPGPNRGKMLEVEPLHAEFLLNADRTVTVTFYDEAGKNAVAPAAQTVTVIAETPFGKAKLELAAKDGAFKSSEPLPEGEGYRVVVQIRDTPEAKPKNFRIDLVTHACGECKYAEYACICDHASEGGH